MSNISPGSAAFYILLILTQGERHGYAIMKEVTILSENTVNLGPATLYTTLKNLLEATIIQENTPRSDDTHPRPNERRRYYSLTAIGKQRIETELEFLQRVLIKFNPKTSI